jgi:hypothetical protein
METAGEISLRAACCACLTELAVNDANTHQVIQNNGIYHLALLILPPQPGASTDNKHNKAHVNLQVISRRKLHEHQYSLGKNMSKGNWIGLVGYQCIHRMYHHAYQLRRNNGDESLTAGRLSPLELSLPKNWPRKMAS